MGTFEKSQRILGGYMTKATDLIEREEDEGISDAGSRKNWADDDDFQNEFSFLFIPSILMSSTFFVDLNRSFLLFVLNFSINTNKTNF